MYVHIHICYSSVSASVLFMVCIRLVPCVGVSLGLCICT